MPQEHHQAPTTMNHSTDHTAPGQTMGGRGGEGKAFVHQRPTVGEWFKTYYVDLCKLLAFLVF